jgi:hypothetical protein
MYYSVLDIRNKLCQVQWFATFKYLTLFIIVSKTRTHNFCIVCVLDYYCCLRFIL